MVFTSMSMPDSLHFHSDREHLLAAIAAADAVVPSSSSKPILTNLQIISKPGHVEITATDGQVGLRCQVRRVQIAGIGEVVVNSRQLVSILRESTSATVTILLDAANDHHVVRVKLDDGEYTVPAVIGETFPPVNFFPGDVVPFSIRCARFQDMLRKTTFAMDKERTSATLSGLSMTIGHGELVIAATDGKVLAESVEKGEEFSVPAPQDKVAVVLPAVAVNHLQRVLGSSDAHDGKLEFAFAAKLVFARLAIADGLALEFTSRLVEGVFPAYRAALGSATGQVALTFNTAQLLSAVRRVSLMTQSQNRAVILNLDRDQAVFSNMNGTNGSARIPVPCQFAGSATRFGLNSQYMQDILKVYSQEFIGIEISRGLIMREPNVTYLVMPISLPN